MFEDNLWAGTLTTKQVLDRYATVQGDSVVFDFGNGDILILAEVDSKQGLSDLMSFI